MCEAAIYEEDIRIELPCLYRSSMLLGISNGLNGSCTAERFISQHSAQCQLTHVSASEMAGDGSILLLQGLNYKGDLGACGTNTSGVFQCEGKQIGFM